MISNDTKRMDYVTARQPSIKDELRAAPRYALAISVLLGTLTWGGMVQAQSTGPAESLESQMGEALMDMDTSTQAPEAAPPAAGQGWYTCDVGRTGPGWGNVYLHLGCGTAITPRWFVARKDQENEILATALTAINATKQVLVYLTGSASYSEIRACYVVK